MDARILGVILEPITANVTRRQVYSCWADAFLLGLTTGRSR